MRMISLILVSLALVSGASQGFASEAIELVGYCDPVSWDGDYHLFFRAKGTHTGWFWPASNANKALDYDLGFTNRSDCEQEGQRLRNYPGQGVLAVCGCSTGSIAENADSKVAPWYYSEMTCFRISGAASIQRVVQEMPYFRNQAQFKKETAQPRDNKTVQMEKYFDPEKDGQNYQLCKRDIEHIRPMVAR